MKSVGILKRYWKEHNKFICKDWDKLWSWGDRCRHGDPTALRVLKDVAFFGRGISAMRAANPNIQISSGTAPRHSSAPLRSQGRKGVAPRAVQAPERPAADLGRRHSSAGSLRTLEVRLTRPLPAVSPGTLRLWVTLAHHW